MPVIYHANTGRQGIKITAMLGRPHQFLKGVVITIAMLCASNSNASAEAKLPNIRSIAIISAIGDSITFASVGPFNFHRGAWSLSIVDWGVDDQLEQEVARKLGGHFNIVHAIYDRPSFSREISHAITVEEPPINDLISKLSTPVDAYLVISKHGTRSTHEYLNLMGGINVLEQTNAFRKPVYALCILIQVQLIDAKTDVPIAENIVVLKPGIRYDDPENQFDPSLWPHDGTDLTAVQESELRKQVVAKLIPIIDGSLGAIGLNR